MIVLLLYRYFVPPLTSKLKHILALIHDHLLNKLGRLKQKSRLIPCRTFHDIMKVHRENKHELKAEWISHFWWNVFSHTQTINIFSDRQTNACSWAFPTGRRLHVGLCVRNGDKMRWDGKTCWPHLSFFPTLTLNYDITSLHNFRICDLGAVFILCNVIQTALRAPRGPEWAKPWNPQLSWEWAHSWTLLQHPDLWGGEEEPRAPVEASPLLHLSVSLVTHHIWGILLVLCSVWPRVASCTAGGSSDEHVCI